MAIRQPEALEDGPTLKKLDGSRNAESSIQEAIMTDVTSTPFTFAEPCAFEMHGATTDEVLQYLIALHLHHLCMTRWIILPDCVQLLDILESPN